MIRSLAPSVLWLSELPSKTVPVPDLFIRGTIQNYALYPHMNVYENMAFGLKMRKLPRSEIDSRVRAAADTLGMNNFLKRRPKALSGGQRQRVAVGRAIVRQPKLFLFDEPLSNLDAKLRVSMRAELIKLHKRLEATMIYVTHDQVEAMSMGVTPARQDSKPGSEPAASSRVTAPQNQRPSPPKFADATSALGLSFQYIGSQTSRKYLLETMGSGVALFDYDNDRRLDIFLVNGAPLGDPTPKGTIPQKTGPKYWNRLYHQKPDGTFEDRTEKARLQGVGYGMGVAVGDYDNDGYEDLYVTAYIRLVIVSSRLGSPRCRTLLSEC